MKLYFGGLLAVGAMAAADETTAASSSRDISYYRPNFVNPALLQNPLYHKTAQSVLENLSNFKALYVKYENCAWAYYGHPYAERSDQDNQNNNDGDWGDEQVQVRGCGYNGRGGEEYWYMGRTACFRAQAAYSLYGIPADGSISDNKKCHQATYINSFFTTMGVEAFAAPLGVDTTYGNGYCTVTPPADGNAVLYDDDYENQNHHDTKYNFASFTSTGTGCQRKRFVTDSYQGAFCDGNDYVETTDTLDDFNQALHQLDCVQIYDSSYGDYEDDANVQQQGEGYQYYDNMDFTELSTVGILQYSLACDVDQYPDSCPDPYGLLHKYSKALKRALAATDIKSKTVGEKVLNAFTGIFFFAAALFAVSTYRKRRRMYSTKAKCAPPPGKEATVELANVNKSESSAPTTTEPKPNSWEKPAPWARQLSNNFSVASASVVSSIKSVQEAIERTRTPSSRTPEDVIVVEKGGDVVATVDAATGAVTPTTAAASKDQAEQEGEYVADPMVTHRLPRQSTATRIASSLNETSPKKKSGRGGGLLGKFGRKH